MNERLTELAKMAGYEEDGFGFGHWDMPECKKFAQLIIEDCLEVILSNIPILSDEGMEDPDRVAYGNGMYDSLRLIEKHFGVEE